MKFTDKYLRSLKPNGERQEIREDSGLIIRVSKTGKKVFAYAYKRQGRMRRVTIGGFPAMPLVDARGEVARLQSDIIKGKDPAEEVTEKKQKIKRTPTVKEFGGEFIKRWAKPNKKSWQKDQANLENYVNPILGHKKISEIQRRDIIKVLDPIRERGAEVQANRIYALIRRMFNFAVERGVIETSPATHIKLTREKSRERVLRREEIPELFKALNAKNPWIGIRLVLEMILRTAQRPGEVRLMEKGEIDREKMIWTIPSEKTKNGIQQTVPLTQKMLSIIDVAESTSNSSYVFCSPRKTKVSTSSGIKTFEPIGLCSLSQAMRKALEESSIERVTPHDLRRSAATIISELGFNRLIVDKILAHKDPTVGGVYDRHGYDKEKRQALEAWESELEKALTGKRDKVINLNSARSSGN
ncbi:MAG: tyrosine-type recombinase/integrase [Desulfohalobiaceae bacterium]|nr:tyrosine-type recombinase/integrase [Desulfohalobiaceae bacterium]